MWCAEVMYNKFFTLSLLRQPGLPLKTHREIRDRGKIYIERKRGRQREKEEQRPGFPKEKGKFNHLKKKLGKFKPHCLEAKSPWSGPQEA